MLMLRHTMMILPRQARGKRRKQNSNKTERLTQVATPFLVLHGTADSIVAPEASEELHSRATATDKTYKMYEGALHGLLCEELPLRATIESVRKTDCFTDFFYRFLIEVSVLGVLLFVPSLSCL